MIIVDIIFSIGLFIFITVMGYKRYKETQDFKDSLSWFLLNMFAGAYLALVHFFTIFNLPLVLDHPFLYSIVILALSMLGVAICYMVRQVTPVILFLLIFGT